MASNELPDLNLLYTLTLKEIQNTEIQQINHGFYDELSQFLGKLKTEEYDGIEKKTKTYFCFWFNQILLNHFY